MKYEALTFRDLALSNPGKIVGVEFYGSDINFVVMNSEEVDLLPLISGRNILIPHDQDLANVRWTLYSKRSPSFHLPPEHSLRGCVNALPAYTSKGS